MTTTTPSRIPRAESVSHLLTGIVGKTATAAKASPFVFNRNSRCYVAAYNDDAGLLAALCICDLPLAAHLASALVMFPPSTSLESINKGKLSEALLENLWEIVNICRQWFNQPGESHLVVRNVYEVVGEVPTEVSALMSTAGGRLDAEVTVAGYGKGRMLILQAGARSGANVAKEMHDASSGITSALSGKPDRVPIKPNCWEVMKCGLDPGGSRAGEIGVCPAACDGTVNGANGGKNGGRVCWTVTATLCCGSVQGTCAQKESKCQKCQFYQLVRKEEGASFQVANQ